MRNRVYDPREGRWMQNDPLGFAAGDQDLYRYCNGEYSTGYDPEGLDGTYYSTATYTFTVPGYAPEPPPCDNGRHEFGVPGAANNIHYDSALLFGTGAADVLSFGLSYGARAAYGGNDQLDTSSGAYQNGVATGVATLATIISGGILGGEAAAIGTITRGQVALIGAQSGFIGGAAGQITEIGQGRREHLGAGELAFAAVTGAILSVAGNEALGWARSWLSNRALARGVAGASADVGSGAGSGGSGAGIAVGGAATEGGACGRAGGELPERLFHYGRAQNAESILENGLGAGGGRTWATPVGDLSPVQAQIELALPPNRGYPSALFEIDVAKLRQMGITPSVGPQRIMSTPNAGGGGIEYIFDVPIPPSAIRPVPLH